jgi:hypothetical protein
MSLDYPQIAVVRRWVEDVVVIGVTGWTRDFAYQRSSHCEKVDPLDQHIGRS